MKKILLGLTLLASASALAAESDTFVNKRISFDKTTYIKAIQNEDSSLLYRQVPANTVNTKSPKEIVKETLIQMVEIRDTMERNGNRDHFSAGDHLEFSRKLEGAISRVEDLNFQAFARNLNTEFNFYLLGFRDHK